MRYHWFLLILLTFCASTGFAAVLHVPSQFQTIQEAVDAALDNDTVLIADGTYSGQFNHNIPFDGKPITVTSEHGSQTCIVDCGLDGRGFGFISGETQSSVLKGITIRNGLMTCLT
jgi:hypothetical protein